MALSSRNSPVELVADDPAKGLGKASRDRLMVTQLGKIIGGVSRQLDLVSAYFVPGREGRAFESLAKQGSPYAC